MTAPQRRLVVPKRVAEDCEPYVYEVTPEGKGQHTLTVIRPANMNERMRVTTDVLESKYVRYDARKHGPVTEPEREPEPARRAEREPAREPERTEDERDDAESEADEES